MSVGEPGCASCRFWRKSVTRGRITSYYECWRYPRIVTRGAEEWCGEFALSPTPQPCGDAKSAAGETEPSAAVDTLRAVLDWATRRCPCGPPDYEVDEPKICPLCLADRDDTVNGFCKAVESTIPPHLLSQMRVAIASAGSQT